MSKKDWSALASVFGKTGTNAQAKNIQKEPTYFDTNFKTFEKSFYGGYEVEAEEPAIPNEEFKKELKMAELCEIALTEEHDTSNEYESVTKNELAKDENGFSADELEEFKKLNGIVDEKEVVKEQPTETKVKSIKVSKPKVVKEKPQKQKEVQQPKADKKEVKDETPKNAEKPTKQTVTKPRVPKKK